MEKYDKKKFAEITKMLCTNMSLKELAEYFNCNQSAISNYIFEHSHRLGVHGRLGLCLWAIKNGVVKPEEIWLK